MKKLITSILALAMMFSILAFTGEGTTTAKAAGVTFKVTASPSEMLSSGGTVSFSFDITNNTGSTITGAKITTPSGKTISIGTIADGDSPVVQNYETELTTIPSDKFVFKLSYDGLSTPISSNTVQVTLQDTSDQMNLSFTRNVDSTAVVAGGYVYVTYELQNNSPDVLTITSLKDNFSSTAIISSVTLASGESKEVIKKYSVTKDISSAPTVTYKYLGKTYTKTLDAVAINVGSAALEISTSSDKTTGSNGDTVKFTTTLKNTGTENLSGITLYDSDNNAVATNISVNAGETKTVETNITLSSDKSVYFTAKGKDSQGNDISFKSNTVSLTLSTPLNTGMEVTVTADKDTINAGGSVTFTFKIKNTSGGTLSNVTVGEQDADEALTEDVISSLASGATGTITVTIDGIYSDIEFTFIAVGTNASGRQIQVTSNTVSINVEGATATPVATGTSGFSIGSLGTLFTIFIIIIVLIVVSVIILLVLVSREKKKKKLIAAQRSKQQLQQRRSGSNINNNGNGNRPKP